MKAVAFTPPHESLCNDFCGKFKGYCATVPVGVSPGNGEWNLPAASPRRACWWTTAGMPALWDELSLRRLCYVGPVTLGETVCVVSLPRPVVAL